MLQEIFLWIFNGNSRDRGELPSGVFLTKENAQKWIEGLGIKGTFTPYPVDISVYDWAIQNQFFTPKIPEHHSREFIAKFILNYYQEYLAWVEQKITGHCETNRSNEINPNKLENHITEEPENIKPLSEVWVFNAYSSKRTGLASAVFRTKENAEKWVEKTGIEGLLTLYPVDISAYDWSVQNKYFTPKKPHHYSPEFIAYFTGGHKHYHYVDHNETGKPIWS